MRSIEPLGRQLNSDLISFHPTSQDEYKKIRAKHGLRNEITQFICSEQLASIVTSILGPNVYLVSIESFANHFKAYKKFSKTNPLNLLIFLQLNALHLILGNFIIRYVL
jgi:hypothetical protein